ncbi:MAG: aminotransferase class V-fold PLP-dependent enzyme [Deltaproteobacteria bacterium]|nr:aminotransferase class V-fold PLP-dependent enzyme [Kofleriaceae bacterium]
MSARARIPDRGRAADAVLDELAAMKQPDADWRGGRVFSLVYHAGEAHEQLLQRAYALYASANLLNPMAFQSLRRMEAEITQMVAGLFHGPDSAVGAVTSGGTESILCAIATYREHARAKRPWIRRPQIVAPRTIHPAFDKAAHWFGVELKKVDVDDEQRARPDAIARAVGRRTIALAASAPQYPHGTIDPIEELGEVATRHGLPLHVDACVGGFMLPWLERLGRPVPRWDFRVPAVTSISADLHKYGYAGKGASTLTWRDMSWMRHQFFVATDFPGGIYVSPTMIGTRPGGPLAAAWAALQAQGEDGYLALTRAAIEAAERIRAGITAIPGLQLLGRPDTTIVAWGTAPGGPDLYAIADRLEARGWSVDRTQHPAGVHLTVTANHLAIADDYVRDVREAADEVRADPSLARAPTAAMYGMMAKLPVRGLVKRGVRQLFEKMYAPGVVVPDATAPADDAVGRMLDKHGAKLDAVLDQVGKLRTRLKRR